MGIGSRSRSPCPFGRFGPGFGSSTPTGQLTALVGSAAVGADVMTANLDDLVVTCAGINWVEIVSPQNEVALLELCWDAA